MLPGRGIRHADSTLSALLEERRAFLEPLTGLVEHQYLAEVWAVHLWIGSYRVDPRNDVIRGGTADCHVRCCQQSSAIIPVADGVLVALTALHIPIRGVGP
eukprot:COSAG01_NODE_15179_length_1364_cov_3.302767_3_plen_100_part_01